MPSTRRALIAGNWKMHTTLSEARSLAGAIVSELTDSDPFDVGLFPPAVSLQTVVSVVKDSPGATATPVVVGAQNMHFEAAGAFTGEISAAMIASTGATAVLLGHSERRHVFGETDAVIARKVARALEQGLVPILCVGETLAERDADSTMEVVGRQLAAGFAAASSPDESGRIVVAYEPVWAIGTGRTATPEQAQEVHAFLRTQLASHFASIGAPAARSNDLRILYGGSVKPENAQALLEKPDIDGVLVGGASLQAASFLGICRGAAKAS